MGYHFVEASKFWYMAPIIGGPLFASTRGPPLFFPLLSLIWFTRSQHHVPNSLSPHHPTRRRHRILPRRRRRTSTSRRQLLPVDPGGVRPSRPDITPPTRCSYPTSRRSWATSLVPAAAAPALARPASSSSATTLGGSLAWHMGQVSRIPSQGAMQLWCYQCAHGSRTMAFATAISSVLTAQTIPTTSAGVGPGQGLGGQRRDG